MSDNGLAKDNCVLGSGQLQNNESKATTDSTVGEGGNYWRLRYEKLLSDYNHLQNINQGLEEKLLNVVEKFEKKQEKLVADSEHEKSLLMTDLNKLSNKLVDARIKLHDYEEIMQSNESGHLNKNCKPTDKTKIENVKDQIFDPNLV